MTSAPSEDQIQETLSHLRNRRKVPDKPFATGLFTMRDDVWRACVDELRRRGHVITTAIYAHGDIAANETAYRLAHDAEQDATEHSETDAVAGDRDADEDVADEQPNGGRSPTPAQAGYDDPVERHAADLADSPARDDAVQQARLAVLELKGHRVLEEQYAHRTNDEQPDSRRDAVDVDRVEDGPVLSAFRD